MNIMKVIDRKYSEFIRILKSFDNLLVAFSGGVDSTLLLKTAFDVLGGKVGAVTARSALFPDHEFKRAVHTVTRYNINHWIIDNTILTDHRFQANPATRCYLCKKALFQKIRRLSVDNNFTTIADGSNFDDNATYRPGRKALNELAIRSPLSEAKLTKSEIRILSEKAGLPEWNRPSSGCLASRFPYGSKITRKNLQKVDTAEACIRHLRDIQVRVRHYGNTARIEVMPEDMPFILDRNIRQQILADFNKIGYRYVTLDLCGYRCGSMDEVLDL